MGEETLHYKKQMKKKKDPPLQEHVNKNIGKILSKKMMGGGDGWADTALKENIKCANALGKNSKTGKPPTR